MIEKPATGTGEPSSRRETRWWGWFMAGCGALIVLGLAVRLPYLMGAGFPLNDGGLPAVMMGDLHASHFALPEFTSYNSSDIPFVYPPLAIYLGAVVQSLGGWEVRTVLLWLPLILSLLCLPAMAFLGRSVVGSPVGGLWAAAAFALLPSAYIWQIMGAGLMRSAGFLFGLLTLWQAHEMLRSPRPTAPWRMVTTGALAALTVLSHPALPIPVATGIVLMWLARSRELRALMGLVGAGAVALLVASPWWITVVHRFGLAPWQAAAATTGQSDLLRDPTVLLVFSGEASPAIFTVLGLLGVAVALVGSRWFLPAWLVLLFLVDPHGAIGSACIPLALLAGLAMVTVLVPGLEASVHATRAVTTSPAPHVGTGGGTGSRQAVILASGLIVGVSLLGNMWVRTEGWTPLHPLAPGDRAAMAWIARNTPSDVTFVALGPALHWYDDAVGEWFPALAKRRSLTTVQGTEWLSGGIWRRRRAARRKLIETRWPSVGAFQRFIGRELGDARGVYLSRQAVQRNPALAHLAVLLGRSPAATMVFSNQGGFVFLLNGGLGG